MLRDCDRALSEFCEAIEPLAEKLACILVQLPPNFSPNEGEHALRDFVRSLPPAFRFAIEFRDNAWNVPRIAELLSEHRVCCVWNDLTPLDHRDEAAFALHPLTTDFIYLRLMGDLTVKYAPDREPLKYDRLMWPRDASLESWALRIHRHLHEVKRVLVLCNNHFEGFAPITCKHAAERLHVQMELPEAARPETNPPDTAQLELPLM